MKFIEDLTESEIKDQINFICRNADITPPSNGREFIAILQLAFGKWQEDLFQKAFMAYVTGKLDVPRSKVMTTLFLSTVVNAYIDLNRHVLRQKPKTYITLPEAKIDAYAANLKAYELTRDTYIEIKKGRNLDLFITSLAIQCDRLELEVNDFIEIEEWIIEHKKKMDAIMASKIEANKFTAYLRTKEKPLNKEMLRKAATFLNHLNEKYNL
jgi:hypothetical protein